MSAIIKKIRKAIDELDVINDKQFTDFDVRTVILNQIPKGSDLSCEELAEAIAFDFYENNINDQLDWGTYFGPMYVSPNGDGTVQVSPSIDQVDESIMSYWMKRANECIHPILKARYAGLVYDFSLKIIGEKPSFDITTLYITSLAEIVEGDFSKHKIEHRTKFKRALTLSIKYNLIELINRLKKVIFEVDGSPGYLGFSFDLLYDQKKIKLNEKEEEKIITSLEERLTHFTDPKNDKSDPWTAKDVANRLAKYYRKKGKEEEVQRVVNIVIEAYKNNESNLAAMQAMGWYEQLMPFLDSYGTKEEKKEVLLKLRKLGASLNDELKTISHEFQIEGDKITAFVDGITDGELNTVLTRIATHFLPSKEKTKEQVMELSKSAPMQFFMTTKIHDHSGRILGAIGPLEKDLDGHIIKQISQNLVFQSIFLGNTIHKLKKNGLTSQQIMQFFSGSPIIGQDKIELISFAIEAYINNDYVTFIHVLIPQIEGMVRNIIEFSDGIVLKPNRDKTGFYYKTFHELLNDDIILSGVGEDFSTYFKMLFTDQRGWNLRNNVCHGITLPSMFNKQNADRVFHALLFLGILRKKTNNE